MLGGFKTNIHLKINLPSMFSGLIESFCGYNNLLLCKDRKTSLRNMMTVVVIASDKQTACKSLRLLSREIASKSSVENINAVHNLYCMLCCWS